MKVASASRLSEAWPEGFIHCVMQVAYLGSGFEIELTAAEAGVGALAEVFPAFHPIVVRHETGAGRLSGPAESRLGILRLSAVADVSTALRILQQISLVHDGGTISFCCRAPTLGAPSAGVLRTAAHALTLALAEMLTEELRQDGVGVIRHHGAGGAGNEAEEDCVDLTFYQPGQDMLVQDKQAQDPCVRLRALSLERAFAVLWNQEVPANPGARH